LWGTPIVNGASKEQFDQLFGKSWATENIAKPKRDIGFWLLRLAGFGYLGFWGVLAFRTAWGKSMARFPSIHD
jgi:hypothetical protein